MVFSSASFLFLFLPVMFVLHLVVPNIKVKNALLTAASLLFYAWGEGWYVLLMIASVLVNWILGLLIAKYPQRDKWFAALAVIANIGMLFAYKYVGFFIELLNLIPGVELPAVNVPLPLGISFFTFQVLSYVIDVYRDHGMVNKSFFSTLFYVSFFPQLIAGPIVKYHDVNEQIKSRHLTPEGISSGIRRFVIGVSKKLLIADVVAAVVDQVFALQPQELSGLCAWLAAILYCVQIYFDFSGYSDMAIGLGRMFGFEFKENFNYPYTALGIQDFWRKWHISLSTWFREYLYIPLGGNRKGVARTYLNLFIVFLATGLWHGANLTFVVWGLYHGVLMVLERAKILRLRWKWLTHIYTLLAVVIGFVIFRADSLSVAGAFLARMFTPSAFAAGFADALSYCTPYLLFTTVIAIVCSTPLLKTIQAKAAARPALAKTLQAISYPLCLVLLLICMTVLASNTYSPFIYFRF